MPLLTDITLTDTSSRKTSRTEHQEIDPFVCELVLKCYKRTGILTKFQKGNVVYEVIEVFMHNDLADPYMPPDKRSPTKSLNIKVVLTCLAPLPSSDHEDQA